MCSSDLHSLRSICQRDGMPDITVVYSQFRRDPDFSARYARAREDQALSYFDLLIDASSAPATDMVEVQAARLRVDTLKWACAKILPRAFADKVQAQLTGADGGAIKVQTVPVSASDLPPEVRESLRQALITAALPSPGGDED